MSRDHLLQQRQSSFRSNSSNESVVFYDSVTGEEDDDREHSLTAPAVPVIKKPPYQDAHVLFCQKSLLRNDLPQLSLPLLTDDSTTPRAANYSSNSERQASIISAPGLRSTGMNPLHFSSLMLPGNSTSSDSTADKHVASSSEATRPQMFSGARQANIEKDMQYQGVVHFSLIEKFGGHDDPIIFDRAFSRGPRYQCQQTDDSRQESPSSFVVPDHVKRESAASLREVIAGLSNDSPTCVALSLISGKVLKPDQTTPNSSAQIFHPYGANPGELLAAAQSDEEKLSGDSRNGIGVQQCDEYVSIGWSPNDLLSQRSTSSFASAGGSQNTDGMVCNATRYHIIDRETAQVHPLPAESQVVIRDLLANCSSSMKFPAPPANIALTSQKGQGSPVSSKSVTTSKPPLARELPVASHSIVAADSSDESVLFEESHQSTKHVSFKPIMPSLHHEAALGVVDDIPPSNLKLELGEKMAIQHGNNICGRKGLFKKRPKRSLPPENAVSGRVKYAAGENFFPMLLISSKKHAHEGPIWIMKFSPCGKYLASAGEDGQILVWEVLPRNANCPQDGFALDNEMSPNGSDIRLLSDEPIQRFDEHLGFDVIDLSWSKSNFLLSACLDKTVRLWHVSKNKSLHVFHHVDFVTSVDFSPIDDQYFLSGGFDKKIRIWSIKTGRVKEWAQTPDFITAAKYSPDGKLVVAGLIKGQVYFYSTKEGLGYFTQISCRNRHGKKKDGRKVTGLHFRRVSKEKPSGTGPAQRDDGKIRSSAVHIPESLGDNKRPSKARMLFSPLRFIRPKARVVRFTDQLLVTTNDSRMRLYGLDDFCLINKFKGPKIPSMQINASFSSSGKYVVCGSEDGRTYIWESLTEKDLPARVKLQKFVSHKRYDRNRYCASFSACDAALQIVTEAVFIPERVVKECVIGGKLSPSIRSQLHYDWSSAMVVTSDYEGTIKVFIQKLCLDVVLRASQGLPVSEDE